MLAIESSYKGTHTVSVQRLLPYSASSVVSARRGCVIELRFGRACDTLVWYLRQSVPIVSPLLMRQSLNFFHDPTRLVLEAVRRSLGQIYMIQ